MLPNSKDHVCSQTATPTCCIFNHGLCRILPCLVDPWHRLPASLRYITTCSVYPRAVKGTPDSTFSNIDDPELTGMEGCLAAMNGPLRFRSKPVSPKGQSLWRAMETTIGQLPRRAPLSPKLSLTNNSAQASNMIAGANREARCSPAMPTVKPSSAC